MSESLAVASLTEGAPASITNGGGKAIPRHVLPFEQPLARLEQQIYELEALQESSDPDETLPLYAKYLKPLTKAKPTE